MADTIANTGKKQFWQKPENLTSLVFFGIIGVVAYKYGAGLLSGALSFLGFLGVSIVSAIILGTIITQWNNIGTIWKVLMYKLTDWTWMTLDPIKVAFAKLDNMKEKRDAINKSIESIKGARMNVERQLSINIKTINHNKDEAEQLVKMNRTSDAKLKLSSNVRLEKWDDQLTPLQKTMLTMEGGLGKLYEAADFVIKDKEDELTILGQQYKSVKVGWQAIGQAKGILGANSREREDIEHLINMAGEDMTNKVAEMDRFMEMAAPVLQNVDIENGIRDAKVQEIVDQMQKGMLDKTIDSIQNIKTKTPEQQTIPLIVNNRQKEMVPISKNGASTSMSKYNDI